MQNEHPLGLVFMTNEQYHAAPGISKSHLDVIAKKSPKHYWEKYLNPDHEEPPKSAVFQLGQAIHTAVLEPETMTERVIVGLPHDRRSAANKQAWAEYELEHAGKVILSRDNFDHVKRVVDTIWKNPEARGLLTGGAAEQSFFAMMDVPSFGMETKGLTIDHDTGLPIDPMTGWLVSPDGKFIDAETGEVIQYLTKCQTDYINWGAGYVLDLKSTEDASEEAFGKSCANYRYPVQNAWYNDVLDASPYGRHPEGWAFMAFEKEPPYAIGIHYLDDFDIARGRIAAQRDFMRIARHRHADHWPDYGMGTKPLKLPTWMKL